ncbi:MAG TPA: YcxB family protein [Candidatus Acidoferrales bacterium]|nr:YcxB family protein [Candidatus Acidoferrales bacterium]
MRITYSFPYEAFVALQPPFVPLDRPELGLILFFQFAGALAGIGFMLITVRIVHLFGWTPWPSAPMYRGAAEFALGGFAVAAVWYFRRRSAQSMRREHDEFLRDRYARLHCRNERFFEATDEGLVFGCNCSNELVPWSRLTAMVESPLGFVVAGERDSHIVPNTGFANAAQRTEFRRLLSENLNRNKTLSARTVEFECSRRDWRDAGWLRFKAGGWTRVVALTVQACGGVGMILYFGPFVDYDARFDSPFVAAAVAFVAIVVILMLVIRRRPSGYFGPLKASFAEDAIYVQSPVSESRVPWPQVTGCMIDRKCLILVQSSLAMLLIPSRYISPVQGGYIMKLLSEKLTRGRGALARPGQN